jgi:hypothetical protein
MPNTLTLVDTAKARAWADSIVDVAGADTARDWVHALADEVESLQAALTTARASEQAALADATAAVEENTMLRTAFADLLDSVSRMLGDLRGLP